MRNLIILLLLLTSFATHAVQEVSPKFDNRQWKLGWSGAQEAKAKNQPYNQVYDEYVLEGETVQNWSELVTIQFFPITDPRVTLKVFEEANKTELLKVCPGANWKTLPSKENEVMWSWDITKCPKAADQSEIVRLVKTQDGIYVFHYAIKKSPMPEDAKKTWENNLNAFTLK